VKVIFVVGPTASGKSDWALKQAESDIRRGETSHIVNCDSIQVYEALIIGAARPKDAELARVPHHLFGFIPKGAQITAGEYSRYFFEKANSLSHEVDNLYVVGGTGFYFQAIEKGMYPIGPANAEIKSAIEEKLRSPGGAEELFQELLERDPLYAQKISLNDHYRLGRALEILRTHHKSVTGVQAEMESKREPFPWPLQKIGLGASKETLEKRIQKRTQKMLKQGLVKEVQDLVDEGFASWPALQSVGYKECLQFLNQELKDLSELETLINQNTLRLTKKQKTWFQRDKNIQWMESPEESGESS
jgi:tRNA dimethylallyltransferase